MKQIKIDKNIPLPKPKCKYPFEKLTKRGYSFFAKTSVPTLNFSAYRFLKLNKLKWKFIIRAEKNGARIWRSK